MISLVLNRFIAILCFIIPIVWWGRLNANYHSTKMTLVFLVGGLAWLALPKKIVIPKFSVAILYGLVTLIIIIVIKHTIFFSFHDLLYFTQILSLWGLFLYFNSLNLDIEQLLKKITYPILVTASTILVICVYEFINKRILNTSTALDLLGTFGNINMFAEFFVLTLPLIFLWIRFKEDKIPQLFKSVIFVLWLFFILYCRSRSAWIGLGLWFIIQLRYKFQKSELSCLALSILLYIGSLITPAGIDNIDLAKPGSTTARLSLYQASLHIIQDNPFGIGVGQFISEINPYLLKTDYKPSEYDFFDSPHSDYLKWGVQYGWIFFVVISALFIFLLMQLRHWFVKKENSFLVGSVAVFTPQFLFQFPFENAASSLYLSLVFALLFLQFRSNKIFKISNFYRFIFIIFSILGLYSSFGYFNAVYHESTYPRNENIIMACELYPIKIKTCKVKFEYYVQNQRQYEFLKEFKSDILKQPLFIDYIKLTPTYYSYLGDNKKTCESLFFYRALYPQHKAFQQDYYDKCQVFSDPFYLDTPASLIGRYKRWLSE